MADIPYPFASPVGDIPTVWIDFETTGLTRADRPVQVGLVRFEGRQVVATQSALLDPGRPISPEATAVHGITDMQVIGCYSVEEFFAQPYIREIMAGAQPAAYNASFDRQFLPAGVLADERWPWLDPMVLVQEIDRFARGRGRFKLTAVCERHGVALAGAHDALNDALAAGKLFYRLLAASKLPGLSTALGSYLHWQEARRADQWLAYYNWLSGKVAR